MKELFAPKELMEQLEAKGFAEDCICGYNRSSILTSKVSYSSGRDCECKWGKDDIGTIRAATWMQIIDYFREKHGIAITIFPEFDKWEIAIFQDNEMSPMGVIYENQGNITYYDALTKAIEESLKLI